MSLSRSYLFNRHGVTLIELLIALVVSTVLIGSLYRTFIRQGKTAVIQEQVIDMQQSARVAIGKMMREIRMAGFGNASDVLPVNAHNGPFNYVINPGNGVNHVGRQDDQITIIGAFEQISTLKTEAQAGETTVEMRGYGSEFDSANKRYVCFGGVETQLIDHITDNVLTLKSPLKNSYPSGTPVFKVKAVTYQLRWDLKNPTIPVLTREDNTDGGGTQPLADNIENLQFSYVLDDGNVADAPGNPGRVRMVRVTVTARTHASDPDFKENDGFRRRQIASNVQVRNLGLIP